MFTNPHADYEKEANSVELRRSSPEETAGLLIALRSRGETVDEITGAARALRAGVLPVA